MSLRLTVSTLLSCAKPSTRVRWIGDGMLIVLSLMSFSSTFRQDLKPSVEGFSFVRSMVSFRAVFLAGGLTGSVNEARVTTLVLIASVVVFS